MGSSYTFGSQYDPNKYLQVTAQSNPSLRSVAQQQGGSTPPPSTISQIRDIFDANTAQDQAKRVAAGQPANYQDQQRQMGLTPITNPFLSIGNNLIKPITQFANTANLGAREVVDTGKMLFGDVTNNPLASHNADQAAASDYQNFGRQNSGLFGQGTFFHNPTEAASGSLKTVGTRIGGGVLQTGALVVPLARGASFVRPGMSALQALPRQGLEGGGWSGLFSTGQQLQTNGNIDPKQLARDTALGVVGGTALGGTLHAAFGGAHKTLASELAKTTTTTGVKDIIDAAYPNLEQAIGPKSYASLLDVVSRESNPQGISDILNEVDSRVAPQTNSETNAEPTQAPETAPNAQTEPTTVPATETAPPSPTQGMTAEEAKYLQDTNQKQAPTSDNLIKSADEALGPDATAEEKKLYEESAQKQAAVTQESTAAPVETQAQKENIAAQEASPAVVDTTGQSAQTGAQTPEAVATATNKNADKAAKAWKRDPNTPGLNQGQQAAVKDFPNGLKPKDITALKKQGFDDVTIAIVKKNVDDALAAHDALNPPQAQVETPKTSVKAPKVIKGDATGSTHYFEESTQKSVPINKMAPKYAASALAKGRRELGDAYLDTPRGQALSARAERANKTLGDVFAPASKEGKLVKVTSLENRLSKLGQTGKDMLQLIKDKRITGDVIRQKLVDKAQAFFDLSPEDQQLAIDVKEGNAKTNDSRIQQAVQSLNDMYKSAHEQATSFGVKVGDKGDTYFNHSFPRGYFDKTQNFNDAVKHLVDSGQAKDLESAVKMMNDYKTHQSFAPNTFGHFKARELNLPGYMKNAESVHGYIKGASDNIAAAQHFGAKGENLNKLVATSVRRGEDAGALKDIMGSYVNPKTGSSNLSGKALSKYQKFLNVIQLPKAVVSHVPQSFANTGSDIGFTKWAKASIDTIAKSQEDKQFLHDAGFEVHQYDKSSDIAGKLTSPGLNHVLNHYRQVAALGGRDLAIGLAKKGDTEALGKLSISGPLERAPDGSITLTHDQQVQAAHHVADKNIGSHDISQSPAWTQGDAGKFFSAYKRAFVFKQSERIVNMFADARNGNVAPLARYLGVALPISGIAITAMKNEIKNPFSNPIGNNPKDFALDSLKNSGGLSLGYGLADSAFNAVRHNYNTDSRYANVASAIAPGLGFAVQTGQNIDKALRGNPTKIERQIANMSPIGGAWLANKIAPQTPYVSPKDTANKTPTDLASSVSQSIAINKDKKAAEQDFIKTLNKNDQALITGKDSNGKQMIYNQNDLNQAYSDKLISQDAYLRGTALVKAMANVTGTNQSPNTDPNIDQASKTFLDKFDKLTPQGQQRYLNGPPDDTAKALTDTLNSNLPQGVKPLTPSNRLLQQYATFQKSLLASEQPDKQPLTDVEVRNRARTFWGTALKQNESKGVQDIYGSNATQIEALLKNGMMKKADLDRAVALDNALNAADISDGYHFSNKFRQAFGYGLQPNGSGSGGYGGSRGKGGGVNVGTLAPLMNNTVSFGKLPEVKMTNAPKIKFTAPQAVRGTPKSQKAVGTFARRIKIKL